MAEALHCPTCGAARPCRCEAGSAAGFALLPCPRRRSGDPERATRLLREVKGRAVRRSFLDKEVSGPLLARMRRLGLLVEHGDLAAADSLAGDLLGTLLAFPRPRRRRVRLRRVVRWAVLLASCAAAVALAYLLTL